MNFHSLKLVNGQRVGFMLDPEDSAILSDGDDESDLFRQVVRGGPEEINLVDSLVHLFVCDGILEDKNEKQNCVIIENYSTCKKSTAKINSAGQTFETFCRGSNNCWLHKLTP